MSSDEFFFNPGWFSDTEYKFSSVRDPETFNIPISSAEILARVSFTPAEFRVNHSKTIYNILDFLGDVGGLFDGLKLIDLDIDATLL